MCKDQDNALTLQSQDCVALTAKAESRSHPTHCIPAHVCVSASKRCNHRNQTATASSSRGFLIGEGTSISVRDAASLFSVHRDLVFKIQGFLESPRWNSPAWSLSLQRNIPRLPLDILLPMEAVPAPAAPGFANFFLLPHQEVLQQAVLSSPGRGTSHVQ